MNVRPPPFPYNLVILIALFELVVFLYFEPDIHSRGGRVTICVLLFGIAAMFAFLLEPWRAHKRCDLFFRKGFIPYIDEHGQLQYKEHVFPCDEISVGKGRTMTGDVYFFCSLHDPDRPHVQAYLRNSNIYLVPGKIKKFYFTEREET